MKEILSALIEGKSLSRAEMRDVMIGITEERFSDTQIAALLMGIEVRGVTVDELLGLRDGLMETGRLVDVSPFETIDIVGTGGDGKNTFNVSTCSCFVVAGAGYKVTKHGNVASTSVSGASNVLQEHGVKFSADRDLLMRSLDECNIAYFHAPLFAYGMKFVAPTRKALQVPTCFNLLGPLVNPCRPKYNLLGTANLAQMRLYVTVLSELGVRYGVVSSYDGYDEISLTGDFKLTTNEEERVYSPASLGFEPIDGSELFGGQAKEDAAKIFDAVLSNTATLAQKNVVIANSAAAIHIMEPGKSLQDCIAIARDSIESGKALQTLKKFVELNS